MERTNLTIGNEVESKNGRYKVINNNRIGGSGRYEITLECLECGEIFTTRTNWKRAKCPKCRKNKTTNSYIGQIFNNYEVLEFDHMDTFGRWYKVKCLNCGEVSIKHLKTIFTSKTSCDKCKHLFGNRKIPTTKAVVNCLRSEYIRGASERNFPWELVEEDFETIIQQPCYFCGQEPEFHISDQRFNKTNTPFLRNGIDRLDPTKGYTKENSVSCCSMCNRMKSNYSITDFYEKIKRIYEKHNLDSMCSTTIEKTSEEDGTE